MKKFLVAFSMTLAVMFATSNSAQAQITTGEQILAAAGNLVNVQVGSVNVNLVDVVDVSNVLNNNDVDVNILNNVLNDLSIDNVLNNLLRDANIITGNQVVVGVLSGPVIVALDGSSVERQKFLVADKGLFEKPNQKPRKG